MNKQKEKTGLELLREPFPDNQISKLPKPTKAQTDAVKADFKAGVRCEVCGGWHHPKVIHLDYVGHAALTDRLLDADGSWQWEPLSFDEKGLPVLDDTGGLWIKLTICGVTRLGYGDAQGKIGGDAMKERIGDALRNAAMRFGAALDLWHKGDLHVEIPVVEQMSPEPIRMDKVNAAYKSWKAIIDEGQHDDSFDFQRLQDEYSTITNDERMAVANLFGSSAPEGSRKGYKALIKELLKMTPADLDNPDLPREGLI